MTEFREGYRGDKARKVVWRRSRLKGGLQNRAKKLLLFTLCAAQGLPSCGWGSTSKTGPGLGKLKPPCPVDRRAVLTTKVTGAQSRDRTARPERGRTAAGRLQLGWHPRDGETERGREEREEGGGQGTLSEQKAGRIICWRETEGASSN